MSYSREQFAEELERAKLDAMKELAYGASHEINNPLANIALRAQTMLKREDDPDKRKMLQAMYRGAMRAHEMISDLMLYARPPALKKESVRLLELASKVLDELKPLAEERGIALTLLASSEDVTTQVDPLQIAVALRAVVENSLDAINQAGPTPEAEVAVLVHQVDESKVTIEVRDNGPGVPEAIRPHVFDPFFSGREAGRGLGFGLSKCWRIVTEHGGTVRLDSEPARGVTVTLVLAVENSEQ